MGKFETSEIVQSIVWQLRLADWPRSQNRAAIQGLFNGNPPFSPEQMTDSMSATNTNDLSATTAGHDARKNFANAFQKPGKFFSVSIDSGPVHKRQEWSQIITNEANRVMKRGNSSKKYFEVLRSTFANVVLFGIGPVVWTDKERWCPDAVGVGDVLIPAGTLLDMDNLPFFSTYHRYTPAQLRKMTSGPKVDPGWNIPLVNQAIKWADEEANTLYGSQWPEIWSPERTQERIKEDGGVYSSDAMSTIDVYDFRFWSDEKDKEGWRRRMVIDPWGGINGAGGVPMSAKDALVKPAEKRGSDFLFNSKERTYGDNLQQLAHFQFADLSAFGPFRYHSVRSLGFLLFSVCHLNNRMWCRFMDHVFENMLQFFRVRGDDDIGRALKINLVDKGIIDQSVQFIPQSERWQINQQLVEMGFEMAQAKMGKNSSSLVEDTPRAVENIKATVYAGEQARANSLVMAAMDQAYMYQNFQYREIVRRLCIPNSRDMDSKNFRTRCLQQGIPEEVLNVDRMDVEAERVMGGGNQQLESSIANQLLGIRPLLDPDAQRTVMKKYVMSISSDPALADELVPDQQNRVTNTIADAQRAAASLYLGLLVSPRPGENHSETAQTVLGEMSIIVQRATQQGPSPQDITGLQSMGQYVGQQIQMLAQDKGAADMVKQLNQALTQIMQMVQKMGQALQKQMEEQAAMNGAAGNGEAQAEMATAQAKNQAMLIQANAKAENSRDSHSQKTAQRQAQFEMKAQQDAQKHQQQMIEKNQAHQQELAERAQSNALDTQKQVVDDTLDVERKAKEAAQPKVEPAKKE